MIIIVDDDLFLAEMLDLLIKDYPHMVVNSIEELYQVPEDTIRKVTKVLTDMKLAPAVDAYTVKEYIRSINQDADIILMTGAVPTSETVNDFDGVLLKPFKRKDMLALID
jgi:DNA-binding NtrC family response regulator